MLMAFTVLILVLCSGLAQAFFHSCSEPGAQTITLERESIALIDDVGYYYSAAVYMCHNNEYIPVCSNAIRSFEAALVCSTTSDLYASSVPGVVIGNLSDYQPDKYRGPYYKNVTCLGDKIDPSFCHVEVGYDNRSCRGHGGVAVVSCFIEGCEESLINIDSTVSYDYYNGLRGESGQLKVCHEGKEIHICQGESESFNFDTDQATYEFCQSRGYTGGFLTEPEPDDEISSYITKINCSSQPQPGSFEGCTITVGSNCSVPVTVFCFDLCSDGSTRLLLENGTIVYESSSSVTVTGIVEVCVNGYWASVCDIYPVDPKFPELVCHTLGYEGGRMINSANRRYGSSNFGVISSINCSSCIGDYCTINDCEWRETDDLLCLRHTRDAAVQCYNGIDCCYGNDVHLHKPAQGTVSILSNNNNYTAGPVKVCVDYQYRSVCADDVNNTIATAMCHSIYGPNVYGAAGPPDSSVNDVIYPLTPTGLTDISCTGDSFNVSSCSYSISDCSNRGGEAFISCIDLCPNGIVQLEERVDILLNNGTSVTLGRPELCFSRIYTSICQFAVTPDLANRICGHFVNHFTRAGLYDPSLLDSIFEFGEPEYNFFQLSNFFCPHNDRSLRHCSPLSIEFDCPPAVIMCAYDEKISPTATPPPVHPPGPGNYTIPPLGNFTISPSVRPTVPPSVRPTVLPSVRPTVSPSVRPTLSPSVRPTVPPSVRPTRRPPMRPTPTVRPSVCPTVPPRPTDRPPRPSPTDRPPRPSPSDRPFSTVYPSSTPIVSPPPVSCESGSVRLRNGLSPYSGLVEICRFNTWGTICSNSWDRREALVACRQLGYPTGSKALRFYNRTRGPIHYTNMQCHGSETSLLDCPLQQTNQSFHCRSGSIAGVECHGLFTCQNSTISVNDTSLFTYENGSLGVNGLLKVCHEGNEIHICYDGGNSSFNFDVDKTINDFCQKEGYNSGSLIDSKPRSLYGISPYITGINCPSQPPPGSFEGCTLTIKRNCSGSPVSVQCVSGCEESLISIDSTVSYDYYNGLSGETGELRVCHGGKEVHICQGEDESFNFDTDRAINEFCQSRGYTGGFMSESEPDNKISSYITKINCSSQPQPGSFEGCTITIGSTCSVLVTVFCFDLCSDGSTRLLLENGTIVYESSSSVTVTGIVEVCVNGYWASVCDIYPVDPKFPELVCHTLGYEGGRMINSANRRYGSSNFGVISSINCSSCIGDYCTINDCEWRETYDLLCLRHTRDAAVQCYNGIDCCYGNDVYLHKPTQGTVSILSTNNNYTSGPVKVCVDYQYRSVCADDVNDTIATAMCHSIYGPYVHGTAGLRDNNLNDVIFPLTPTGLTDISCTGDSFNISSCSYSISNCSNRGGEAFISCADLCPNGIVHLEERVDILLSNGTSVTLGRPELCFSRLYTSICQFAVTPDLANHICGHFVNHFTRAGLYDPSLLDSIFEFGEPEYNFFQLSNFSCPHNDRSLRHCTHSIEFGCPPAVIMCAYDEKISPTGTPPVHSRVPGNFTINPSVRPTVSPSVRPTVPPSVRPTRRPPMRPTPTVRPPVCPTVPPRPSPTDRPPRPSPSDRSPRPSPTDRSPRPSPSDRPFSTVYPSSTPIVSPPPVSCESGSVRLRNGPSPYSGLVEICRFNAWGTICSNSWDRREALVACRQLGYPGTGSKALRINNRTRGPIHYTNMQCHGSETSLLDCPIQQTNQNYFCSSRGNAGVECSAPCTYGSVALLDYTGIPTNRSTGTVGLCIGGMWTVVCDYSWSFRAASVACRSLHGHSEYGATPLYSQGVVSYAGVFSIGGFSCQGNETSLLTCKYLNVSCTDRQYAGVICKRSSRRVCNHGSLRLVNGSSNYTGRLEVCINGQWGTVCSDQWNSVNARIACRQMGFPGGRAQSTTRYGPGVGSIFLSNVVCYGHERKLLNCYSQTRHACTHSQDIGINCEAPCESGEVVLVKSNGYPSNDGVGMIRVCQAGERGTICDDGHWDYPDAAVVCKQAGYSPFGALPRYGLKPGASYSVNPVLSRVECLGNESNIRECHKSSAIHSNCNEYVGVECYGSQTPPSNCTHGDVRLMGGSQMEGRLELCINNMWGTVCDDFFDVRDARVTCRKLGNQLGMTLTGAPSSVPYGAGSGPIFLDNMGCSGNENDLLNCLSNQPGLHNCQHFEDVGITCTPIS